MTESGRDSLSEHETHETDQEKILSMYRDVLSMLEWQIRGLEYVDASSEHINLYRKIVKYLRNNEKQLSLDISRISLERKSRMNLREPRISLEGARRMDAAQVEDFLSSSEDTSRAELEMLARGRFGVTPGSLSNLRSRKELILRLRRLVENERAHDSIARLASGKKSDPS